MMHEFRLPSVTDASLSKRPIEKNIPINDSWAICRIFKKTSSMAQRVLSRSWPSPPPEPGTGSADLFSVFCNTGAAGSTIQFAGNNSAQHPHSLPTTHYPTPVAITTNKPNNLTINSPKTSPLVIPTSFVFHGAGDASTPSAASKPTSTSSVDVAAMLLSRLPPAVLFEDASMFDFGHRQQQQQQLQQCFTIDLPEETSGGDLSVLGREIMCMRKKNNLGGDGATSSRQCSNNGTRPASLCPGASHGWRPNSTAPWDSPPCPPSEVSLINLAAELD